MTRLSPADERSPIPNPTLARLVAVVAATIATATAPAITAAAVPTRTQARSIPANLCTLPVKSQLKALGVTAKCTSTKTAIGAGAHWGAPTHGIGITVWTSVPASRFKSTYAKLGTPVQLGNFAREADGPMGVTLNAWVGNVGLSVTLVHRAGGNKAARPLVLAFAKAIAKQL
jgi:hypothetical protein